MPTKQVTLDPSESKEAVFTFTPSEAKVHSVSIDGLSGSFKAIVPAQVTVYLKNPPSEGINWKMDIYSWDKAGPLSCRDLGINEPCIHDIPMEWSFPLRFVLAIYLASGFWLTIQSFDASFADYKEVFVPELGYYYFNVATEEFEPI